MLSRRKNKVNNMNELDILALKYGTDKASNFHNYTEIYYNFFNPIKDNILNILEIGVFQGNSLRMWKDFFKNANIYGLDINNDCYFKEDRIEVIIDNQTDINIINKIPDNLDLIIDDGGHKSEQQIQSFNLLFSKIKPGGTYIVEDVCCSYWKEFNMNSNQTTIEYFKTLIDHINFFGYKVNDSNKRDRNFILNNKPSISEYEKNIEYIIFANSLIFIKKIK
jgi:hypothetical protein